MLLELHDEKAGQKTAMGIILPDSAKEKEKIAKILAISNIENPEFSIGDFVLYKEYSGTEVTFDGKKFLFLPYGDILAKVIEMKAI